MRKDIVLQVLLQHDDPVRGHILYRECSRVPGFEKYSGSRFWYADFPYLMNNLVNQGLIAKFKVQNKVWYLIAEKGMYRTQDEKKSRKRLLRKLRYWIDVRTNCASKTSEWAIESAERAEQIIQVVSDRLKDGKEKVQRYYYLNLVREVSQDMEYGGYGPPHKIEWLKERLNYKDEMLEQLILDARKLVTKRRYREEQRINSLVRCFVCNNMIHRKDVVKMSEEIAKRTNVETGVVCCYCYDVLIKHETLEVNY